MVKWVDGVWRSDAAPCDLWRVEVAVHEEGPAPGRILMARNGKELQLASTAMTCTMLNYCG